MRCRSPAGKLGEPTSVTWEPDISCSVRRFPGDGKAGTRDGGTHLLRGGFIDAPQGTAFSAARFFAAPRSPADLSTSQPRAAKRSQIGACPIPVPPRAPKTGHVPAAVVALLANRGMSQPRNPFCSKIAACPGRNNLFFWDMPRFWSADQSAALRATICQQDRVIGQKVCKP